MIRHGVEPFLECSTKGDIRFSAFGARIKKRNNKTIEELYQAFKVFEGGITNLSWRETKGKKAINQEEAFTFYTQLWREYMMENLHLLPVLEAATGLSDIFGQKGSCCQATELWNIRNSYIEKKRTKHESLHNPDSSS